MMKLQLAACKASPNLLLNILSCLVHGSLFSLFGAALREFIHSHIMAAGDSGIPVHPRKLMSLCWAAEEVAL